METTRKWRWGVNRWIVLGFIIFSIIAVNIATPVQPHIQVAPERITEGTLNLGPLGEVPFLNTFPTLLIVDLVIILLALAVRQAVKKGDLIPRGIAGAMESLIEVIYNLTESAAGKWTKQIFPWFATIMLVVLVTNMVKLLPGFETIGVMHHAEGEGHLISGLGGNWYTLLPDKVEGEGYVLTPFLRALSTDLNFTVALALISVVMTQVIGIRAQGPRYFSKFLNFTTMFKKPFFGFMDFLVGLLETISEFAKILSFAFRLFGNMFAGFVLMALISAMIPIFVPSMITMFEFFIGLIQAFVFGMLTMVFMAQATQGHGGEEEHH
ncbi:MAG TPA: F0F1 ATP synthase subunit A [Bellilinea sp.]|uniref:ATP synthase subunit a n=1 Tax=uncultured Chloroflexi bacterium Rifle_16ft_4_minimus_640 TaxID=1665080 RepID=A0A0H4TDF6_9CHLR|nr:ATP synthase subunit A, F-type H+-transporting ATPase subunit a [uncultured Chloroflexi bacterium Rifle_16ft_4_minimus_640]